MVWNSCQYLLSSVAREVIIGQIDVLDTWLIGNDLWEKVYVSWVFKQESILSKIKINNWVNAGNEKGFEN